MRIAILIPTRGDRPKLLENCLRMMARQTPKPPEGGFNTNAVLTLPSPKERVLIQQQPEWSVHVEVVGDAPRSEAKDITWRYRSGYDRLRGKGYDVIAFVEDDDWYAPDYLATMVAAWEAYGRPELFGTDYTIYYHLRERAYFMMNHPERASAMNTLIMPDLDIRWCVDEEPYTDQHLWMSPDKLKGVTWHPDRHLSLGIKHGVGLCGGHHHSSRLDIYKSPRRATQDPDMQFLRGTMDEGSFEFYEDLINRDIVPLFNEKG